MSAKFLPAIDKNILDELLESKDENRLYDLLVTPLHEELYRRQDFNFMDDLSEGQQLLLAYDYLNTQVGQGGFIQFLVNGYIGLLPEMPGWLNVVGAHDMSQVIDDVIKVYVLNYNTFSNEKTPEEFAKLYDELKEFEILEERFHQLNEATIKAMMQYAKEHLDEFIKI